jgi:hypothetical protein
VLSLDGGGAVFNAAFNLAKYSYPDFKADVAAAVESG